MRNVVSFVHAWLKKKHKKRNMNLRSAKKREKEKEEEEENQKSEVTVLCTKQPLNEGIELNTLFCLFKIIFFN